MRRGVYHSQQSAKTQLKNTYCKRKNEGIPTTKNLYLKLYLPTYLKTTKKKCSFTSPLLFNFQISINLFQFVIFLKILCQHKKKYLSCYFIFAIMYDDTLI